MNIFKKIIASIFLACLFSVVPIFLFLNIGLGIGFSQGHAPISYTIFEIFFAFIAVYLFFFGLFLPWVEAKKALTWSLHSLYIPFLYYFGLELHLY